jgi:alpha-D-ribose 1-methylphosphonate 5-phosphate C-P lyase
VITDDRGSRMFVCSDTDHCATRRTQAHSDSSPKWGEEAAPT